MQGSSIPKVYLDYAAVVPPALEKSTAYAEYQQQYFVNPHGGTEFAEKNRRLIFDAGRRLLACLGIPEFEATVIWCSGCTEALNLAVRGSRWTGSQRPLLVDVCAHPAMLEPVWQREREETPTGKIRVDGAGQLRLSDLTLHVAPGLVAVCHVNNETGVVQDLPGCRRALNAGSGESSLLLVDAAQSLGQVPIPWHAATIDLLALSGHKIGCPAPLGALICRKGVRLTAQILGGGQQQGLRSGTLDAAAIRIFADTAETVVRAQSTQAQRLHELKDLLLRGLAELGAGRWPIFSVASGSPHLCTFAIPGQEGALVVRRLAADFGIVVASGSACSAERGKPSQVLLAMGIPASLAMGAIRVSMGIFSQKTDICAFLQALKEIVIGS